MIDDLEDGDLDALILDSPVAAYRASIDCDIYEVGDAFHAHNYGIMFSKEFDFELIEELNVQVVKAFELGVNNGYENEYFLVPADGSCLDHTFGDPHTIQELAGIWILLSGLYGLALIIFIVGKIIKRRQENKEKEKTNSKETALEMEERAVNRSPNPSDNSSNSDKPENEKGIETGRLVNELTLLQVARLQTEELRKLVT